MPRPTPRPTDTAVSLPDGNTADTANQAVVIPVMLAGSTLWGLYWLPLRWLEQAGLGGRWALTVIYI
ncbi:MAG: hypothetical protein PVG09_09160, partial [Thiohalocapsa sp.]